MAGCLILLAIGPVAVAQAATSITGTVINTKSAPLEGIKVEASSFGGGSGSATTGPGGTYTISSGLSGSGGEYTVKFTDPSGTYVSATKTITVAAGETKTLNATLITGGKISGRVTSAATGAGLAGATVEIVDIDVAPGEEEYDNFTFTNANGEYSLADLPPGTYVIEVFANSGSYLPQTTRVTLLEGETKAGVNVALKEGGKISGTVTSAATHAGLAKIGVYAFGTNGEGFASTNANGEYTIAGLPTGSYKVEFYWEYSSAELKACEHALRCPPAYITQYYNDQPSAMTANAVTATEGGVTAGINAAMVPSAPVNTVAPTVSGTPAVGDLLSCSNGSWTGENELTLTAGWPLNSPFSYQWLRDSSAIAGVTSSAYLVQAADVGHSLACEVTVTNVAGHASAKSNSLAVLLPAVTFSSAKVAVSGGSARVPIACKNAACAGTIELTGQVAVKRGRKTKKRTIVLAKGSYSLAAGKSATITVRLTAGGRSALAKARRHRLSAKANASVTGGMKTSRSVVLSQAGKKHK